MNRLRIIRYKKYYLYCYEKCLYEQKNNLINKDVKVLRLTMY